MVLDPFGGTGTTVAVAKRLKRNFITMEISKEYYDIILKRLDGKFAEIKREIKTEPEQQMTLFDKI